VTGRPTERKEEKGREGQFREGEGGRKGERERGRTASNRVCKERKKKDEERCQFKERRRYVCEMGRRTYTSPFSVVIENKREISFPPSFSCFSKRWEENVPQPASESGTSKADSHRHSS